MSGKDNRERLKNMRTQAKTNSTISQNPVGDQFTANLERYGLEESDFKAPINKIEFNKIVGLSANSKIRKLLDQRKRLIEEILPDLISSKISTFSPLNWFSSLFNPAEDRLIKAVKDIQQIHQDLRAAQINLDDQYVSDRLKETMIAQAEEYKGSGLCKEQNILNELIAHMKNKTGDISQIRGKISSSPKETRDLKIIFSKICAIGLAPGVKSFDDDLKKSNWTELNFGFMDTINYLVRGLTAMAGMSSSKQTSSYTQAATGENTAQAPIVASVRAKKSLEAQKPSLERAIEQDLQAEKSKGKDQDTAMVDFLNKLNVARLVGQGKMYDSCAFCSSPKHPKNNSIFGFGKKQSNNNDVVDSFLATPMYTKMHAVYTEIKAMGKMAARFDETNKTKAEQALTQIEMSLKQIRPKPKAKLIDGANGRHFESIQSELESLGVLYVTLKGGRASLKKLVQALGGETVPETNLVEQYVKDHWNENSNKIEYPESPTASHSLLS